MPVTIHEPPCRLVIDPRPSSGAWNMAVDEALLEAALERRQATLRWYRWSEATVSLGYFQKPEAADPALAGLPRVRRLSGGGAILHHHELTYSCALPPAHPLAREPHGLYRLVHERIIAVLRRWGAACRLRGEPKNAGVEPFLCFGRGDALDVVLEGQKIVGSAQRRRRGAVLQHGSLLLTRSEFAPEFPGIRDLAPIRLDVEDLERELALETASRLAAAHREVPLPGEESRRACALQARYRTLDWGRSTPTDQNRRSADAGGAVNGPAANMPVIKFMAD